MAEYRVEEGESRDDVVLLNGNSLLVSGGTVNGAVVSEGGLLDLNVGTVNDATVFGSMFVSGGLASGTVLSGGSRAVTGGGTALHTYVIVREGWRNQTKWLQNQ